MLPDCLQVNTCRDSQGAHLTTGHKFGCGTELLLRSGSFKSVRAWLRWKRSPLFFDWAVFLLLVEILILSFCAEADHFQRCPYWGTCFWTGDNFIIIPSSKLDSKNLILVPLSQNWSLICSLILKSFSVDFFGFLKSSLNIAFRIGDFKVVHILMLMNQNIVKEVLSPVCTQVLPRRTNLRILYHV